MSEKIKIIDERETQKKKRKTRNARKKQEQEGWKLQRKGER